jgi:hypothetical protein
MQCYSLKLVLTNRKFLAQLLNVQKNSDCVDYVVVCILCYGQWTVYFELHNLYTYL